MKLFGEGICTKEVEMSQATPWTRIYTNDEWHEERMRRIKRHKWRMRIMAITKKAPRYIFLALSVICIGIVSWAGVSVIWVS